jgi:hypothetical protein
LCDGDQLRKSVFAEQANCEEERGGIADEHLRARRRSARVVAVLVWWLCCSVEVWYWLMVLFSRLRKDVNAFEQSQL